MDIGIDFRIKYDLGNTPAVTQVDENHSAVVTAAENPAHERDLLVQVVGAELITVMRAPQRSH